MPRFGNFGESHHVALIGDIVGSRRIGRRAQLQRKLQGCLESLNNQLGAALVSPLVLLRGDEIQGLFAKPEAVVQVVVGLAEELFPVELVYGIGFGELATELHPDTTQLDGPCFHRARSALESIHKTRDWLRARGFGSPSDDLVSAHFQLMRSIRSRWTERQNQIARAARHKIQKDIARDLDVSPSVVSESLKAAGFHSLREAESAIGHYLEQFGKSAEPTPNSAAEPIHHP